MNKQLLELANKACERARSQGAQQAGARVSMRRLYKVVVRDGKVEEIKSSTSRALSLRVYVDGRYGGHGTSDLSEAGMARFIDDAVAMTRFLMPDKHRALPEPKYYEGRSQADLGLHDPDHGKLEVASRRDRAMALCEAARQKAGEPLISGAAGVSDSTSDWVLVQTNGFADGESATSYGQWAEVSLRDPSGRRPSDWAQCSARRISGLETAEVTGGRAAARALRQIGAKKVDSVKLPLVIEARAVSRVLGGLLAPLSGGALDQKRSCFEGHKGKAVAAPVLSITDDPLIRGGWGSRRFDGEGLTARRMPVIDKGVLRAFYIDTYYGRKLEAEPTTGGHSNLVFATGRRDLAGLCKAAGKAILITRFIGGNSNSTTGDFSHGIAGFLVDGGVPTQPLASMNIAGNHLAFWKGLRESGNDPYPHSSILAPSLLLAPVLVSGK